MDSITKKKQYKKEDEAKGLEQAVQASTCVFVEHDERVDLRVAASFNGWLALLNYNHHLEPVHSKFSQFLSSLRINKRNSNEGQFFVQLRRIGTSIIAK